MMLPSSHNQPVTAATFYGLQLYSSLEVVFSIFSQDKNSQADNQRHLRDELEMTQSRTVICLALVGHGDLLIATGASPVRDYIPFLYWNIKLTEQ